MENYLQQGITAAKAGDRTRAFDLLSRASEIAATSEQAWLWLSSVVGDDSERLFCLDSVLRLNPDNAAARRGAVTLRQKGVFPAVPVYPGPWPVSEGQGVSSKAASLAKSSELNIGTPARSQSLAGPVAASTVQQPSVFSTDSKKQELSSYFQYAVLELSSNKSQQAVEKLLVGRGASIETAKLVVKDAQHVVKKARQDKHKKRMTRGLIWTVLGVVLTCGTYAFASELGGKYVLFYGAILFGFIDFIIGLFGWLANS